MLANVNRQFIGYLAARPQPNSANKLTELLRMVDRFHAVRARAAVVLFALAGNLAAHPTKDSFRRIAIFNFGLKISM